MVVLNPGLSEASYELVNSCLKMTSDWLWPVTRQDKAPSVTTASRRASVLRARMVADSCLSFGRGGRGRTEACEEARPSEDSKTTPADEREGGETTNRWGTRRRRATPSGLDQVREPL